MCEYVNIWASVHGCICVHAWDTCNFACLPGCVHTHAHTHTRTHARAHTHRRGARVNGVEHIPTALVADSGQIRADIEGARK